MKADAMINMTHNPFDEIYRVSRLRENFTSGSDGEGLETGRASTPISRQPFTRQKVFDQFKNKLMENRAWAKSPNGKCAQAQFMALTHNLTLLLERKIEAEEGISDTKIEKKRKQRIQADRQAIQEAGRKENPLVTQPYKAVQRSFQFLRWLRNALLVQTSSRPAIEALRPLMLAYLS